MINKYFIKEKCKYHVELGYCLCKHHGNSKGEVRGADITEWVTGFFEEIDNTFLIKQDGYKFISKIKEIILNRLIVEEL